MNKVTRMLAIAGMTLATGATIGAAPVQASSTIAPSAISSATTHDQADRDRTRGDRDRDRVFRTKRACWIAGKIGERRGWWDDFECERRYFGFGRVRYVLEVERDNDNWWGNNDNNGWWDRRG